MELTLHDSTKHLTHRLSFPQKDGPVRPKDRSFAYGYKVESVCLYDGRIGVFINVVGQGFEETDMTYTVVTGEIDQS